MNYGILCDTRIALQLCRFDLRKAVLTQYVSVVLTFDGHLPASSWKQSLLPLLEVKETFQ